MLQTVEIEDIETWPQEFRDAAIQNRGLLLSYHKEFSRIFWECQRNVELRCNPPLNQYEAEYKKLVSDLESTLIRNSIVGFHCTRLTREEIIAVKTEGLKLLTSELIEYKLQNALQEGYLSQEDYNYLRNNETVVNNLNNRNGRRIGLTWFCPNRSTLKKSGDVYRLFRSWGGEALYCGHEEDEHSSRILRRVGIPCIVKCSIPFTDAEQYYLNYTEPLLSQFVSDEIDCPEPSPDFDMNTKRDLFGDEVTEIIEFNTPQFELFTQYKTWSKHHQIFSGFEIA